MDVGSLFLKEGRKRRQSPDRLDVMIPLTSSFTWVSLLAVGILLLAALVWSVFGMIVVKVPGQGIILDTGGIYQASSLSSGKVAKLFVQPGTEVKKGDVVAVVTNPEQEAMKSTIQGEVAAAESKRDAQGRVSQFNSQSIKGTMSAEIVAEYSGVVDEVAVRPGDIIGGGAAICTIRRPHGQAADYGVMYVAAKDGKKIVPGMVLQLTPSGTDSSLDGSLMASVSRVSQYPVSEEVVRSRVKNVNLSQAIMQAMGSSCMEVTFKLIKDKNDSSGYLWTSKVGRPQRISAGSTVEGFAVVDRISPISKVFLQFSNKIRTR